MAVRRALGLEAAPPHQGAPPRPILTPRVAGRKMAWAAARAPVRRRRGAPRRTKVGAKVDAKAATARVAYTAAPGGGPAPRSSPCGGTGRRCIPPAPRWSRGSRMRRGVAPSIRRSSARRPLAQARMLRDGRKTGDPRANAATTILGDQTETARVRRSGTGEGGGKQGCLPRRGRCRSSTGDGRCAWCGWRASLRATRISSGSWTPRTTWSGWSTHCAPPPSVRSARCPRWSCRTSRSTTAGGSTRASAGSAAPSDASASCARTPRRPSP